MISQPNILYFIYEVYGSKKKKKSIQVDWNIRYA